MKERITISIDKNLSKVLNFLKKKKEKSLFINNVLKNFLLNAQEEELLKYFNKDDLKYIKMFLSSDEENLTKNITNSSKNELVNEENEIVEIPETDFSASNIKKRF